MKTDARIRYTRMRLREAFLTCLAEKPVSKITVKELCDRAEINRATFYKHYADPFDLLDKLEGEALAWLETRLGEHHFQQDMMLTILRNLCDEDNPYHALASANGDPSFPGRVSALFYREFRPRLAQILPHRTEDEQTAAYLFLVGGCGRLLAGWLQDGKQAPPEEVAARLQTITEAFLRSYGGC